MIESLESEKISLSDQVNSLSTALADEASKAELSVLLQERQSIEWKAELNQRIASEAAVLHRLSKAEAELASLHNSLQEVEKDRDDYFHALTDRDVLRSANEEKALIALAEKLSYALSESKCIHNDSFDTVQTRDDCVDFNSIVNLLHQRADELIELFQNEQNNEDKYQSQSSRGYYESTDGVKTQSDSRLLHSVTIATVSVEDFEPVLPFQSSLSSSSDLCIAMNHKTESGDISYEELLSELIQTKLQLASTADELLKAKQRRKNRIQ